MAFLIYGRSRMAGIDSLATRLAERDRAIGKIENVYSNISELQTKWEPHTIQRLEDGLTFTRQQSANGRQRPATVRQGSANTRQEASTARQESIATRQGSINTRQGSINTRQGLAAARQGLINTRQESPPVMIQPNVIYSIPRHLTTERDEPVITQPGTRSEHITSIPRSLRDSPSSRPPQQTSTHVDHNQNVAVKPPGELSPDRTGRPRNLVIETYGRIASVRACAPPPPVGGKGKKDHERWRRTRTVHGTDTPGKNNKEPVPRPSVKKATDKWSRTRTIHGGPLSPKLENTPPALDKESVSPGSDTTSTPTEPVVQEWQTGLSRKGSPLLKRKTVLAPMEVVILDKEEQVLLDRGPVLPPREPILPPREPVLPPRAPILPGRGRTTHIQVQKPVKDRRHRGPSGPSRGHKPHKQIRQPNSHIFPERLGNEKWRRTQTVHGKANQRPREVVRQESRTKTTDKWHRIRTVHGDHIARPRNTPPLHPERTYVTQGAQCNDDIPQEYQSQDHIRIASQKRNSGVGEPNDGLDMVAQQDTRAVRKLSVSKIPPVHGTRKLSNESVRSLVISADARQVLDVAGGRPGQHERDVPLHITHAQVHHPLEGRLKSIPSCSTADTGWQGLDGFTSKSRVVAEPRTERIVSESSGKKGQRGKLLRRSESNPEAKVSSLEELYSSSEGSKQGLVADKQSIRGGTSASPVVRRDNDRRLREEIEHRSRSLPPNMTGAPHSPKRNSSIDTVPLRYFAYLGKRFQFRDRLPSAHNINAARPVILTSTSVVTPNVTNNFRLSLTPALTDTEEITLRNSDWDEVIDCCTCMCCVKALFYHCTKDGEVEGKIADDPCACSRPYCCYRWTAMGVLSLFLPCLCCFIPLQRCAARRQEAYTKTSDFDTIEMNQRE